MATSRVSQGNMGCSLLYMEHESVDMACVDIIQRYKVSTLNFHASLHQSEILPSGS